MNNPVTRRLALAGTMAILAAPVAFAIEAPLELKWASLVPAEAPKAKPKAFFSGATPVAPDYVPPPPDQEAKWMSKPGGAPTATPVPVPVVAELDGKRVRIGGYVVPLDFDTAKVSEFLLVPLDRKSVV